MTKKTIGWGLIGTGRIAEDRMLPGINAFKQNKLIGVVSRDAARAQDFAKRFGAQHAYTNFDDLLRNPEVDAVAIHTPNSLHCEEVLAAARAGKHVFCDKPMATTVADAERMLAACDKAGVQLGMNFHNRSMPCFIETKRIVDSGEIGEVTVVELEASPGYREHRRARLRHPALHPFGGSRDGVLLLRHPAQRDGTDQYVDAALFQRRGGAGQRQ